MSLETNPCFHAQLIYDKVNTIKKKTAFSINHVEKLDSYMPEKKKIKKERNWTTFLYHIPIYKNLQNRIKA